MRLPLELLLVTMLKVSIITRYALLCQATVVSRIVLFCLSGYFSFQRISAWRVYPMGTYHSSILSGQGGTPRPINLYCRAPHLTDHQNSRPRRKLNMLWL